MLNEHSVEYHLQSDALIRLIIISYALINLKQRYLSIAFLPYPLLRILYTQDHRSTSSGKSKIMSFLVRTSSLSEGVQNTSAALTHSPPSTKTLLAMLDKTSFVPERLKPAPSNLQIIVNSKNNLNYEEPWSSTIR